MKKITLLSILSLMLFFVSCKNEGEKAAEAADQPKLMEASEYPVFTGEYFYSSDGAVLKGSSFIYAVKLDDKAKELSDMIAPIKKEEYDMVPVMVRGVVERNPALDEGQEVWEEIITIKEIVSIGNAPTEADIRIEESKS